MGYSVEKAKQRLEMMKSRKSQWKDYWGTKPGPNRIRVLPNWMGEPDGDFFRETGYHRKLGTERDKSAVCLKKEGHPECPVCQLVSELYKTKNKEDVELAKSIRVQTRVLFNIVDLSEPDKGVQVWITGADILEQILGYIGNNMYGDLTDPETGRNITVVFTEGKSTKSGFNEYVIQPDPERTMIENPEWLEKMTDLDSIVKPMSLEDLETLLTGDEAPKPLDKPVEVMTCFENAKYSPDDLQCVNCTVKVQCQEKKAKRIAGATTPSVTTPPNTVQLVQQPAPVEKPKASSSEIQQKLDKIRKERMAERAAKGN